MSSGGSLDHWALDVGPAPAAAQSKAVLNRVAGILSEAASEAVSAALVDPRINLASSYPGLSSILSGALGLPIRVVTEADVLSPQDAHVVIVAGVEGADSEVRRVLQDAWRQIRPAGRLIVLGNVVPALGSDPLAQMPLGIDRLIANLNVVSGTALVMEDIKAIRWPYDTIHRAVLISVTSLALDIRGAVRE